MAFSLQSMVRGFVLLVVIATMTEYAEAERNASFDRKQWTWMLVSAGILAVAAAWGIGANDVANAFATSVGSGALSVKHAIILGAILEPLGAVLLGGKVMETMRGSISNYKCYQNNPALLMYGMTCVIFAVAVWLATATYLKMPVSTTHSCVGGIVGMTLMTRGRKCVMWNYRPNQYCIKSNQNQYGHACLVSTMGWDNFPWLTGVSQIVASWVISPVFSGIASSVFYFFTRYCIMERKNSYQIVLCVFPLIVALTFWINYIYIVLKGASNWTEELHTVGQVRAAKSGDLIPVANWGGVFAAAGAGITVCVEYFIVKDINFRMANGTMKTQEEVHRQAPRKVEGAEAAEAGIAVEVDDAKLKDSPDAAAAASSNYVTRSFNRDALDCVTEGTGDGNSAITARLHAGIKYYDPKTEEVFKAVQVFTAMVNSFSHGANDVANAMGPFAAVYFAWKDGFIDKKPVASNVDAKWILLLGGLGMTIGLSTYGYKIIQAIGVELIAVTPSRGYCIELGAAFVIIYGSSQGWPLSTTHCQVGATIAIGLFDGASSVNGREVGIIILGWLATLLIVGLIAAILVGPSPEPVKGVLELDGKTVKGYCENYINWKVQQDVGRGKPGFFVTTPAKA